MNQTKSFLFLVFSILLVSSSSRAQEASVPHYLNFQSVLMDDGGNLITDEFIDLEFRIVDQAGQEIYHEVQPGVQVVKGAVNVMIGEGIIPGSNPQAPTGGLPSSALDPTTGQKFITITIGENLPSDPMELGTVPYSVYAEKALTVAKDSIGSEEIKDGSIELKDLSKAIQFTDVQGVASEGQIPTTIATDTELAAHAATDAVGAHLARNIRVEGPFLASAITNVEEVLKNLDEKIFLYMTNANESISTTGATLQTQITNHVNATTAHGSDGNVVGINTLNAHAAQTQGVHGLSTTPGNAIVGTTETQTLTNKTLESPTINNGTYNGGTFTGSLANVDTDSTNDLTTSTSFGGDVSGAYNAITITDDSHNHTGSTISGLSSADFTSANISQWTNDSNYIADGNTGWDNSYGFITDGNTGWDNSYGFITDGNQGWDNSYGFITATDGNSAYVNVTGDTMTGTLNMGGNNVTNAGNFITSTGVNLNNHETRIAALEGVSYPLSVPNGGTGSSTGAPIAKAWVKFHTDSSHNRFIDGASFNISDVVYSGTDDGGWAVIFATPFSDANYVMAGSAGGDHNSAMMLSCINISPSVTHVIGTDKNGKSLTGTARSYNLVFFGN